MASIRVQHGLLALGVKKGREEAIQSRSNYSKDVLVNIAVTSEFLTTRVEGSQKVVKNDQIFSAILNYASFID